MFLQQCLGRGCASGLAGRSALQFVRQFRINRNTRNVSPISKLPITRQVDVTVAAAAASPGATTTRDKDVAAPSSFQDLKVMQPLVDALSAAGITQPTEIQALAVPSLLSDGDWLLASHTGSGKTLAYLLPLIQQLKQQEQQEGYVARPKRPRVLVLGPTKELTDQINSVAKSLSHYAKFRSTCCNAGGRMSLQARSLSGFVDILVATPTRLLQHTKDGNVALGDVGWLVLDEADTMFDQGFGKEVGEVLEALRQKPQPAHVVLVSATMTKAVQRLVSAQLPDAKRLETSGLHRGVANSRHVFSNIPPGRDKLDMLAELISGDARRGRKVLVFCGSMDSCRAAHHYITERDISAVCYHGDMPIPERKEAMMAFAGANQDAAAAAGVMIATDLAARGLDFPAAIDHVVNFDFPRNPIDYLHRTGRTARAGAPGKITSFVAKRDKVLADRIEWALAHNEPLDQLSSKKEVLPPSQRQQVVAAAAKAKEAQTSKSGKKGVASSGPGRRGSSRFSSNDAKSSNRGAPARGGAKVAPGVKVGKGSRKAVGGVTGRR